MRSTSNRFLAVLVAAFSLAMLAPVVASADGSGEAENAFIQNSVVVHPGNIALESAAGPTSPTLLLKQKPGQSGNLLQTEAPSSFEEVSITPYGRVTANALVANSFLESGFARIRGQLSDSGQVTIWPEYNSASTLEVTNAAHQSELEVNTEENVTEVKSHLASGNHLGSTTLATVAKEAGSGATISLSAGSNDTAGIVTITTGSSPAIGSLGSITFNTAFSVAPSVILTPGSASAATIKAFVSTTATAFSIAVTGKKPKANTTYVYNYQVMGLLPNP